MSDELIAKLIGTLAPEKRAALAHMLLPGPEPIAVIGLGCRFPGADGPDAFWNLLVEGKDGVAEVPSDRWDREGFFDPDPDAPGKMVTKWGGFLSQIDRFDAPFFGISAREAVCMDPQQRLLLEVTYEALENAGQSLERLAGSATGVFVGISNSDYQRSLLSDPERMDVYSAQGGAFSIASGRVSYLFDFQGPNVAIDTACSSSLVTVHMACQSLRSGESSLALSGGVNLIVGPEPNVGFSRARMMSPNGRCKTFDASADGYVRGEGCGMVVLKRLADAQRDGDRILAVIRGSAINQDGRSNGITAPNLLSQQALLRSALSAAGVQPADLDYVEAHGTGTPLGDPIEVSALKAVLATERDGDRPIHVGSVKTNIGHLESAAGVAGLIKVILSLGHEAIPPHLHFERLNPYISLEGTPFRIPTAPVPWPRSARARVAGVSSFGFSGTNAHVVVAEAPAASSAEDPTAARAALIPLSARSPEALTALVKAVADRVAGREAPSLRDLAYTAAVRRSHHDHRLAVVASSSEELSERLAAHLLGQALPELTTGRRSSQPRKLAFVFSGQGPQWWAMGQELLEQEPVFREAIEACDRLFEPLSGWSILAELRAGEAATRVHETEVAQPALFAIQVGLAALWRSWGVLPEAVVGHSIGEVAAAHVAGALSLEDAVRVVYHRGRLMQQATGRGKMAAVELSRDEAEAALAPYAGRVALGAVNGPTSVTITGDPLPLDELIEQLQARGVLCRPLKVNYAFHSHQLDPYRGELESALSGLEASRTTLPLVSTLTGTLAEGPEYGAGYWGRQMREPVLFAPSVEQLVDDGFTLFLELAPHPVLAASIDEVLAARKVRGRVLPSMRRGQSERAVALGSLGVLFAQGVDIRWEGVAAEGRLVDFPTYPWQRTHYWFEPTLRERVKTVEATGRHPLLGMREETGPDSYHWEVALDKDRPESAFFWEHRVNGVMPFPGTGYVDLALSAARDAFGPGAHALVEMRFKKFCMLKPDEPHTLHVFLAKEPDGRYAYEVKSPSEDGSWDLHAKGRIARASADETLEIPVHEGIAAAQARCRETIESEEFYQALLRRGFQHGPSFCGVQQIWRRNGEAIGFIRLQPAEAMDAAGYQVHPALLDATLSVLFTTITREGGHEGDTRIFLGVDELRFFRHPGTAMWLHGISRPDSVGIADALMLDEAGNVVAEARGVRSHLLDTRGLAQAELDEACYALDWESLPAPEPAPGHGDWLVIADLEDLRPSIVQQLEAAGDRVWLATRDSGGVTLGGERAPFTSEGLGSLLTRTFGTEPCRGVVYLAGLAPSPVAVETDLAGVLALVQALGRTGWKHPPRLYLATQGDPGSDQYLAHAPLWGLGRVVSQEHPELDFTHIALSGEAQAEHLAAELRAAAPEDQVQWIGATRHVARLVRHRPASVSLTVRSDATYLLTGGLGGLGLATARWLVEEGARSLVLVGRSAPTETAAEAIRAMEALGARVRSERVDVSHEEQVRALVSEIQATMPPLAGVVHAAGFLADQMLMQAERDRFLAVLPPKVAGAWNLHHHTRELALDFFVMFSSAASLLGSAGQGNYAAANAYMDALAHHRRSLGLPSHSINWGPWAEVGMGAAEANRGERLAIQGMASIPPAQGFELLGRLLTEGQAQVAVMPINWSRWLQSYPQLAAAPVLERLVGEVAARTTAKGESPVRRELLAMSLPERAARMHQLLRDQVAAILKADPARIEPDAPLPSLGVDSLMSLELKNWLVDQLEIPISATVVFLYPTIQELAAHLASELAAGTMAPAEPAHPAPPEASARELTVVIPAAPLASNHADHGPKARMDFSLFYFSSSDSEYSEDKYRLYLEGARFADRAGFEAVWTPERHFHAFGGVYPNPSVLSGALAMVTERIRLRAGSVVLPLHHPVRVAEEWAVVDNLSKGRVDLAFTTGWNATDFLLRPENYERREAAFVEGIDALRRLWRGQSVQMPNGKGELAEFKVFPAPRQPELPIWITASKGPERFVQAGAMGANLLTALLLQSVEELAEKIALYRQARADNGHDPAAGRVTLMVHTYVGEDLAAVRQKVRKPFIEYIKSSVELWSQFSKDLKSASETDQQELLDVAFERYFRTAALFGTVDSCMGMVEKLERIGVNEIACLLDFGLDGEDALQGLGRLDALRARWAAPRPELLLES